jgi:hypothetical protein
MSLSVETVNTKNTMSHYERLIKQHEALTRELHSQFPDIGMLEYLEEEIEELEEEMDLELSNS